MSEKQVTCPHCSGEVAVGMQSFLDTAETFEVSCRSAGEMIDARSCAEILRAGAESIEGYAARLGRQMVALLVGCETSGPEFRARLLLSRKHETDPREPTATMTATGTPGTTPPDDSAPDPDPFEDERRYAADTAFLPQLAHAITEWYGERCQEEDPDCVVCQLWKSYDTLNTTFGESD